MGSAVKTLAVSSTTSPSATPPMSSLPAGSRQSLPATKAPPAVQSTTMELEPVELTVQAAPTLELTLEATLVHTVPEARTLTLAPTLAAPMPATEHRRTRALPLAPPRARRIRIRTTTRTRTETTTM